MHSYLSQGTSTEDFDPQLQSRFSGTDSRPTAFIGACNRGPVNTPRLVGSFTEFETVFGALSSELPLTYAVRMYFLNGGTGALVNRVVNNAKSSGIELQTDDSPLTLWAVCPGTEEFLRAAIDFDGIEIVDADCFNLTIQRLARPFSETVVDQEIFSRVSLSEDDPRFILRALAGSALVRVDPQLPSTRPHITLNHRTGKAEFFRETNIQGDQGRRPSMSDIVGNSIENSGLFAFRKRHNFAQLYIPPPDFETDIAVPVLRAAAGFCERRQAVLIADAPRSWGAPDEATEALERYSLRASNIALYYPWLISTEVDSGLGIELPPGGAVAGALDRCMQDHGPAGTPAGRQLPLRSVRRLTHTLDEARSYQLSSRGVNTLRAAGGGRKVIWDGVLLCRENAHAIHGNSLKLRRLFQFIRNTCEQHLDWVHNECNDEALWQKIHSELSVLMVKLMQEGVLQGTVPDNAFKVRCDLSTNPMSLRSDGKVGIEVDVALVQPSRFSRLSLTLTAQTAA